MSKHQNRVSSLNLRLVYGPIRHPGAFLSGPIHWRIQEFTLGGPNQDPQSKVEGKVRIEGAKRPRIEGEAQTEGEAEKKRGEGSGEGAR